MSSKRKVDRIAASESGRPGGGKGRRDVVEPIPEGIRIDPDIIEGHPGYEESGSSEIMPIERLAAGEKTKGKAKHGKR